MARIFKPTYPKMQTITGPDNRPVNAEKTATRGPNKAKRILVALQRPVRDREGKAVLVESRK